MPSSNLMFIGKKIAFVDSEYEPITSTVKDPAMQGQKLDISGLDKAHLASRLYVNLKKDGYATPLEITELLIWFRKRGNKIYSFNWRNLDIDLSQDLFDPSEYDILNDTYSRDDILTAYQCVKKLKNDLEQAEQIHNELTTTLKNFLQRDDVKLDSSDEDAFFIYFSKDHSFYDLVRMADSLKEKGLKSYAQTPENYRIAPRPACIKIYDSYEKIFENLRFDNPTIEQKLFKNN